MVCTVLRGRSGAAGTFIGFAAKSLAERLAYPGNVWVAPIVRLATVFILFAFWPAVYGAQDRAAGGQGGQGGIGGDSTGLSLAQVLAWAGASTLLDSLLAMRLDEELAGRIERGDIVFDLMRPTDLQLQMLGRTAGATVFTVAAQVLPVVGVLLIATTAGAAIPGPAGLLALGGFLVSVVVAYLIKFVLLFGLSMIGFWTMKMDTWTWLLDIALAVLSGAFVPLWLLPDGVRLAVEWLPFGQLYHTPLSIYIGRVTGWDAAGALTRQLVWLPVLWLGARGMLRLARRKVLIQGG